MNKTIINISIILGLQFIAQLSLACNDIIQTCGLDDKIIDYFRIGEECQLVEMGNESIVNGNAQIAIKYKDATGVVTSARVQGIRTESPQRVLFFINEHNRAFNPECLDTRSFSVGAGMVQESAE